METSNDLPAISRLIDVWQGGDARDPAAVVAEHWMRAPDRLRRRVRELTIPEARLWYYLGDRDWMKTEVFPQVPVCVPACGFGCVLGFLIPRVGVALEVDRIDLGAYFEDEEKMIDYFMRHQERDRIVEEWFGITTLHLFEARVAADPERSAKSIRWDLGLAVAPPRGRCGISVPR